jgi:hypothetical protein
MTAPLSRRAAARLALFGLGLAAVSAWSGPARAQSLLDGAKNLLNQGLGGSQDGTSGGSLTGAEIEEGLREALAVGSRRVVEALGATDGFNADPVAHIPLPDGLKRAQSMLQKVGLGAMGEEVELKMNRAAEAAMDESGEVLVGAIRQMTLEDARGILNGPEDAATQYLQRVAGSDIKGRIRPIVDRTLSEVGALAAADRMLGEYDKLPFVPDVKADLTEHATQGAYDGLFHYIAEEEAAIRADPAARTTDILKRVFAR